MIEVGGEGQITPALQWYTGTSLGYRQLSPALCLSLAEKSNFNNQFISLIYGDR